MQTSVMHYDSQYPRVGSCHWRTIFVGYARQVHEAPRVPPIFLLSCERAGSTLLRLILDTHPQVAAPGELGLGQLLHRLMLMVSRTLGQTEGLAQGQRVAPVEPWWREGSAPATPAARGVLAESRRVLDDLMGRYTQACHKTRWCSKAPGDVPFAELLRLVWPEARFICLHRNSLDVAHSCITASQFGFMEELAGYAAVSPTNTWSAMLQSWTDKTEQLLEFQRRWSGQTCRIRYEDVVRQPQQTIAGLLEFLDLQPAPQLIDQVFQQEHHRGGGDPKVWETCEILASRVGHFREFPQPVAPLLLRRINELHRQLGYPRLVVV